MATLDRPGFFQRIGIAFRSFFRLLGNGDFARKVVELESLHSESQEAKPPAVPLKPESSEVPKPSIHPLQLIGILQREGRLLDFLMEEIENLPDAQIGAAVREVHKKSAKALRDHVTLASVVETLEDEKMTVASGYDPSAIRVTGNLGAQPPYTGYVRHRGWKVTEMKLQPLPVGVDPKIITPAEIEVM